MFLVISTHAAIIEGFHTGKCTPKLQEIYRSSKPDGNISHCSRAPLLVVKGPSRVVVCTTYVYYLDSSVS